MGILSFYPGIGNLGLSKAFPLLFVIGNHYIFSFLEWVGKSYMTTSRGKSQDYCENGKSLHLVCTFIVFLYFLYTTASCLTMSIFQFLYLLIVLSRKINTAVGFLQPLLLLMKSRISTTQLILVTCLTAVWDSNP